MSTYVNKVANTNTPNVVPVQGNYDTNNNLINLVGPGGKTYSVEAFYPPTNDYTGILSAYNNAVSAGGGVVKLGPFTYEIGANTLPISTGVSYIGTMPTISNLWGDSPDIGAIQKGGTIINGTGVAMAAATTEGAQFNGSITSGVLTVSAININPTGNYGKIITGAIIFGTGVPAGDNLYPIVVAQLTSTEPGGALGGAGTYSLTTTKGPINSKLPHLTTPLENIGLTENRKETQSEVENTRLQPMLIRNQLQNNPFVIDGPNKI